MGDLPLLGALAFAVGATQALGQGEAPFSYTDPPKLCSEVVGQNLACVKAPVFNGRNVMASPVRIDMPVMRVNTNFADDPLITAEVTFTMSDGGSPSAGFYLGVRGWARQVIARGMRGYATENAEFETIYLTGGEACGTSPSCTYTTNEFLPFEPGWYELGSQNGLGWREVCRPTQNAPQCSPNAGSGSAFYVPIEEDVEDPYVKVETTGSGLTTKAIAQAADPLGEAMTLRWDFGDGTIRTGALGRVVTHTYALPGDYRVTAYVATADGRGHANSVSAKVEIPKPVLQGVARRPGGFTPTGVAAGTLQNWPQGARAYVRYWTDGCPANPEEEWQFAGSSVGRIVQADGIVSMHFNYLPQAGDGQVDADANAFMMVAEADIDFGDVVVPVLGLGDCMEMPPGTAYQTDAGVSVGGDAIPVDSVAVPVGNIAVLGAGSSSGANDISEQRQVLGHGSILVDPLDRELPAESWVMDAGAPLVPYTFAPPPDDPVLLPFDAENNPVDVPTDTDGDSIPDEVDTDDDNDGIPDTWEEQYELDPLSAADAQLDPDEDGYTNLQEYREGLNPTEYDVTASLNLPLIYRALEK